MDSNKIPLYAKQKVHSDNAADHFEKSHCIGESAVGDPGEVIVSEARERGSDLIVIGDACKGRSEEYKAKINVGKLLRSAPCSVLQAKAIVREEDAALIGAARVRELAQV